MGFKEKALMGFLFVVNGLFFLLAENAAYATDSAGLGPKGDVMNVPYRTSYVLYSQYYRFIPIFKGDKPNPPNCIRSFAIPYACPPNYAMTISGSLGGGGGTAGSQTSNSVQGFGLKHLNITSNAGTGWSTISYCAYTFYGKRQRNANRAWLSYTVYCNGSEAASTTQA